MALRTESYATSVELTLGGFLFSILLLDWLRPMMQPNTNLGLGWVLHVLAACLFGLIGVLLVSFPACRKPWVAIVLTFVSAPLLSVTATYGLDVFHRLPDRPMDRWVGGHAALIGLFVAPFIAFTFLRRQPRSELRIEEASCQRAAWAVMLLALAGFQVLVAGTNEMWGLEEAMRRRPDSSTAVGLLAVIGLLGIVIADTRLTGSLRRAMEDDGQLAGERIGIEVYGRLRAKGLVNLGIAVFAVIFVVVAHQVGGPSYALYWPFSMDGLY